MSGALLNWEEKVRTGSGFRVQGSGFRFRSGSGFTVQLKNRLQSIQNPSGPMRTASSQDTAARLVATSPPSPSVFAEGVTSLDLIRRARSPQIRAALLVALGYYVGARIGFALTLDPSSVPMLWPPTAILLAGLLLTPVRSWAVVVCRHLRGSPRRAAPRRRATGDDPVHVREQLGRGARRRGGISSAAHRSATAGHATRDRDSSPLCRIPGAVRLRR